MREFDIILIGAGNSADVYRAANAAGLRTAVIEKGPLGGKTNISSKTTWSI